MRKRTHLVAYYCQELPVFVLPGWRRHVREPRVLDARGLWGSGAVLAVEKWIGEGSIVGLEY